MRAWLLVLLLVPAAAAYDESEAPALRDDVMRVWHEPAVPEPGEQWMGYIQFEPAHNVTAVRYQICNVGAACFNPHTLATQVDDNTWSFDTRDYVNPNVPDSEPVPWGDASIFETWRVGVQFFLIESGAADEPENWVEFPHGEDLADEACEGRTLECIETHYLAWDMPAGEIADKESPGPLLIVPLLIALLLRRR